MTNQPDTASAESSSTPQPADRLRALLERPKPKDAAWQDEAGRMVSLLAVSFPQEADEAMALSVVALVNKAASKNVKEAKRRIIRLTRWAELPPPSLDVLGDVGEQRAAVTALAKIKAPWARGYIDAALVNAGLPPSLVPDLLRWARFAALNWATFVTGTYARAISECGEVRRANLLLKEAPRLLRPSEPTAASIVAEALASLARAISEVARQEAAGKASAATLKAGLGIIEQAWRACPALLLQPAFVSAIMQLSTAARTGKKTIPASVDAASSATLTLVMDSVHRFGKHAIDHWRPLVPMWVSTYPGFVKQVQAACAVEPGLAALLSDGGTASEEESGDKGYAAEAAFATLLPAWDAFVTSLPDPSRADSLGTMLRRAAGTVGVESFGVVGGVVDYDPLAHHLAGEGDDAPAQVLVVRQGALARREDGSIRILVRGLVKAV